MHPAHPHPGSPLGKTAKDANFSSNEQTAKIEGNWKGNRSKDI